MIEYLLQNSSIFSATRLSKSGCDATNDATIKTTFIKTEENQMVITITQVRPRAPVFIPHISIT